MAEPVPCPICKKPSTPEFRPFCSRRCADIDLGRWFSEDYRVPAAPASGDGKISDTEDDLPA
ncbi:MAG: DNA gyrase inhibitor YacG [Acetobacter aceti]|uniref:DNA gyrase inhibitor YacG n=1 Tax=Acetobacter aceti TaxID=435 RepID=UPI00098BAF72|nr:DNA gyrase inhibitor YacG [Acetobacter aceti]